MSNQELHLNWSLSLHIQNNRIDEAKMVLDQMSKTDIEDSYKTIQKFISSAKMKNAFAKRYKQDKSKNQLSANDFLKQKLQLLEQYLSK